MMDTLVRRLIEWRYERALRQVYLGNSLRISEHQLPEVWDAYSGACRVLDLPNSHHVYVTAYVPGLAMTFGSKDPIIVFSSGLLRRLGPGERRVVMAHELGHILSDHMVYMTALNILLSAGGTHPVPLRHPIPRRQDRAVGVVPRG